MYVSTLTLVNFKNYQEQSFRFDERINCFTGNNGSGKTNILDALHYLSLTKSYFNNVDSLSIKYNEQYFIIKGIFIIDREEYAITVSVKQGAKKTLKVNDKEYARFADHIGNFPVVVTTPSDIELILEGSETRRNFINNVICQYDKDYLFRLMQYNRLIQQRNEFLKAASKSGTFNKELLETLDLQIIPLGTEIHTKRLDFIKEFIPIFSGYYQKISGSSENIDIAYDSQLNNDTFSNLLKQSLEKDRILLYTTTGVHKDDLLFTIDGVPIKKVGSQGQQKTYLLALKLAKFDFIKKTTRIPPILLLDDIFDKLDNSRVERIFELIGDRHFGQIFITDTHPERIQSLLKNINAGYKHFSIEHGKAIEL